jgi:hypothetical protein
MSITDFLFQLIQESGRKIVKLRLGVGDQNCINQRFRVAPPKAKTKKMPTTSTSPAL